ncbi:ESX secretion-associated protein EspG [Actinokineospora globicatena]|uniref:ESX secretion-associated protein EspG n=1 Tax=Actinokineospora globicatena TaxID=103729 RepID=UPI0024A2A645|nr:ESX secretion-associated protein EspG [Actinokineospora globicatena]MCP2300874.1 EspG family protein [Actinokineospora globicatena]GLW77500.1 ESX secretion-associated protein EspG [Actinokineospora globicatena]GLW84334.1 ESX secretion-associated protein EspG [Actinokineospora globicatena]
MLDQPLVVSARGLGRVVRGAELGELHIALAQAAVWVPQHEERAAEAAAMAELAGLGKVDGRGRIDPDLLATVSLLCRPRTEFYGWITSGDRTIGILAAASGRDAVLAVRVDGSIHLRQISPDRLPDALVEQVPDVRPGQGQAFTVSPPEPSVRQYTSKGGGSPEIALAQRIAELPTTGGGQLSVAVRDQSNRRSAAPHPLRYADSTRGRWLNHTLPGSRVVIAPAGKADLVKRLKDLHRALI